MKYNSFLNVGKIMAGNKSININTSINTSTIKIDVPTMKLSIQDYHLNYHVKLNNQLKTLENELDELDKNILDLENKNAVLNVMLNNKFGTNINTKNDKLNNEKFLLNTRTISHIKSKKETIQGIIEKTNIYNEKNKILYSKTI